jgi:death on curing protein
MTRYLTVEEILRLHALEIGADVGLRNRHLLEAAAERPQQSAFGDDAYPDLASKAAALLDSLVRNHPFVDGNKRIGVLASFVFVDLNGYTIDADKRRSRRHRARPDHPEDRLRRARRTAPTVDADPIDRFIE